MLQPIADFCTAHELPWGERSAEKMARYLDLLMQFNEAMNLIGPMGREAVVEELLLDSVAAAAARRPRGPILDVGTGAGLPGIPLKILFSGVPLTLVEPRRKRSTFLKIATHRLDLDEVTIFRGRIEEFDQTGFDTVISKAFQAPTVWLHTARPFVAPGGAVICMARCRDKPAIEKLAAELEMHLAGTSSLGARAPQQRVNLALQTPTAS